jgi:nucleotide-binding universal stress UspA family protein
MNHNKPLVALISPGATVFERILVPLDGSRLSARALPYATSIARLYNSEIMLIRIVQDTKVNMIPPTENIADTLAVDIISEQVHIKDVENAANAKRYLMNRAKEVRDLGITVTYHVVEGSPAYSIMHFSKEHTISLIVMMSHGRGRFKRAILGSVADAVIRGTDVPVLVVRASDDEGKTNHKVVRATSTEPTEQG